MLKTLLIDTYLNIQKILPKKEAYRFYEKAESAIQRAACTLDDYVFTDYPEEENNTHIFYGAFDCDRTDDVEKAVLLEALEILTDMEKRIKSGKVFELK